MSQFAAAGGQKFASISVNSTGDNTAVAAVSGKKIRVLALEGVATGAVTLAVKSDTGGSAVALTGAHSLAANQSLVLPFSHAGWFETEAGKALNLSLGGNVAFQGSLVYQETP